MKAENGSFPDELTQIGNYISAKAEISKAPIQHTLLETILAGLSTIIPDKVHESRILANPDLLNVTEWILRCQVALNDKLDLSGSNYDERFEWAMDQFNFSVRLLEDKAQAFCIQCLLRNLIAETTVVEAYAHHNQLALEDTIKYRRLLNAIGSCAVTSTLLGRKHLSHRLFNIKPQDLNFESIYKKYAWVFSDTNDDGINSVELAVKIMDRIATVCQIDDDWFGRHIDSRYSLPTMASAALLHSVNNQASAERILETLRQEYIQKARSLGLGLIPTVGSTTGFRLIQSLLSLVTSNERFRDVYILLRAAGIVKMRLPQREAELVK